MTELLKSFWLFCAVAAQFGSLPHIEDESQLPSDDCSRYLDENEIHKSFPTHIDFNASSRSWKNTWAVKDEGGYVVRLSVANVDGVPSSVFCYSRLQVLHVRNSTFQDSPQRLPAEISRLAATLTELRIYDSLIAELPEAIGRLKRLTWLTVSNTNLRRLPDSIGELPFVVYLDLSKNQLASLPASITKTFSLSTLVLDENHRLQSLLPLDGHPTLSVLRVDNCSIERLPMNLPQLTHLYIARNSLTSLDGIETLGYMTNSNKTFYFYKNFIGSVTALIKSVRNLRRVSLADNQLTSLPLAVFNMPTLRNMSIKQNYFTDAELADIVFVWRLTNWQAQLQYTPQKRA